MDFYKYYNFIGYIWLLCPPLMLCVILELSNLYNPGTYQNKHETHTSRAI